LGGVTALAKRVNMDKLVLPQGVAGENITVKTIGQFFLKSPGWLAALVVVALLAIRSASASASAPQRMREPVYRWRLKCSTV